MSERKVWFTSNDPETGAPVNAPQWADQYLQEPAYPDPPSERYRVWLEGRIVGKTQRQRELAARVDAAIEAGRSPWEKIYG